MPLLADTALLSDFKGTVEASITKAGLCIKTRNAAAPLACTRHKICDNLEMDIKKVRAQP